MNSSEELRFVPVAPQHFLALIKGAEAFSSTFGNRPAPGLREFVVSDDVSPEFVASLGETSGADPWRWGFFVVHNQTSQAIGNAGFKGPPNTEGLVEIAYAIVPSFENRGYATAAANHLVEFARQDPRVTSIQAHTLPEPNASTRVLQKAGFVRVGAVEDPEDGLIWQWKHEEPDG